MSEETIVEQTEFNPDYQRLFLAAVALAGGTLTVTNEDYANPPTVAILAGSDENALTFQVVADSEFPDE